MQILKALIFFLLPLYGFQAFAHDIFEYQGGYSRTHGGAGITLSKGGEAILYNPANLWASKSNDFYLDIAPSNISFEYTPPDPDLAPGKISVPVAPLLSFGGSAKEAGSGLSLGFMFIPTGVGTTIEVEDFPISLGGDFQTASIEATQTAFKTGFGLAYEIFAGLSLGFSVFYDYSNDETKIILASEDSIKLSSEVRSLRPILGLRYEWPLVGNFGLSYHGKSRVHYTLKAEAFGSSSGTIYRNNYRPTVIGGGLRLRPLGRFEPFGEYFYEKWVPATFDAVSPFDAILEPEAVEYLNTNNFIIGSRIRLLPMRTLVVSYSSYSKNKGSGIAGEEGAILMQGRGAQDFEALDRRHYTAGYEMASSNSSDYLFYGSYIKASALSEEDTPSAGFYDLTILMLGFTYVWK